MKNPEPSLTETAEKHGLKVSEDGERITGRLVRGFPVYSEMSPFEGKRSPDPS